MNISFVSSKKKKGSLTLTSKTPLAVLKKALKDTTPLSIKGSQWEAAQQLSVALYERKKFVSKPKKQKEQVVLFSLSEEKLKKLELKVKWLSKAKQLIDMPANFCTPSSFVKIAKEDFAKVGISTKVINVDEMKKLGMGLLLSVARGAAEKPFILTAEYCGNKDDEDWVTIVGKGVTFDSGGICLKPPGSMGWMKADMSGAAVSVATLGYLAEVNAKKNIRIVVPLTENMISGASTKPGDVIISMDGTNVEIENTDAEGRLILADALTYTKNTWGTKKNLIITVATLTGAAKAALGSTTSAFFTEKKALASKLHKAGIKSNDKVWRMPMDPSYLKMLDSKIADISNCAGSTIGGGATAGAMFLRHFIKTKNYIHLDIAGTAWIDGPSGRPLPLLASFLA